LALMQIAAAFLKIAAAIQAKQKNYLFDK